jgi:hypothetical protein
VKEWEKDVFIKPITVAEQIEWEKGEIPEKNFGILLYLSIHDAEGKRLFENEEQTLKLPAKIGRRLFRACLIVSRLRKIDVEEDIKNLESILQD